MNSSIVFKFGGGILAASTSACCIAYIATSPTDIYIFAISENIDDPNQTDLTEQTYKELGCSLGLNNSTSVSCEIFDVNKDNAKKYLYINDMVNAPKNAAHSTKDKLKGINNIFKIKTTNDIGDLYADNAKISVFLKNANTENDKKSYANLKPLFMTNVNDDAKEIKPKIITKTKNFVFKSDVSVANADYKCFVDEKQHACAVYNFGVPISTKNNITQLNLTKPTETINSVSIEKNQHYLVQFTAEIDLRKVKKSIKITKKDNTTISGNKMHPIYYVDNQKNIWIMDQVY